MVGGWVMVVDMYAWWAVGLCGWVVGGWVGECIVWCMMRRSPFGCYPHLNPNPNLQIDDPLDAIAVHMVCGMWGMLGSAAFASENLVTRWYGPYPGPGGGVSWVRGSTLV